MANISQSNGVLTIVGSGAHSFFRADPIAGGPPDADGNPTNIAGAVALTVSDADTNHQMEVTNYTGVTMLIYEGAPDNVSAFFQSNVPINDDLSPGPGYTVVYGGFGVSNLVGGPGTNVLIGRGTSTTVTVGSGSDQIVNMSTPGSMTIVGTPKSGDFVYNPATAS
jgi:hypothetical protein